MTKYTGNFHRKGYLMLHHLAGATIQVANLVNFNCHSGQQLRPQGVCVCGRGVNIFNRPNLTDFQTRSQLCDDYYCEQVLQTYNE